jgi:hypothetical protein
MNNVEITTKKQRGGVTGKGFLPGESGNPKGRPIGSISIMGRIKKIFEENPEQFEEYVISVINDKNLRREVIHHIDGKPKDRIEMSGSLRFGEMETLSNEELERIIKAA